MATFCLLRLPKCGIRKKLARFQKVASAIDPIRGNKVPTKLKARRRADQKQTSINHQPPTIQPFNHQPPTSQPRRSQTSINHQPLSHPLHHHRCPSAAAPFSLFFAGKQSPLQPPSSLLHPSPLPPLALPLCWKPSIIALRYRVRHNLRQSLVLPPPALPLSPLPPPRATLLIALSIVTPPIGSLLSQSFEASKTPTHLGLSLLASSLGSKTPKPLLLVLSLPLVCLFAINGGFEELSIQAICCYFVHCCSPLQDYLLGSKLIIKPKEICGRNSYWKFVKGHCA
ncbi:hypothetical protein PIB30_049547, partial [Stylosanthes scabra]|nr:hypothetical protein [Stylosanthes scabra]